MGFGQSQPRGLTRRYREQARSHGGIAHLEKTTSLAFVKNPLKPPYRPGAALGYTPQHFKCPRFYREELDIAPTHPGEFCGDHRHHAVDGGCLVFTVVEDRGQ